MDKITIVIILLVFLIAFSNNTVRIIKAMWAGKKNPARKQPGQKILMVEGMMCEKCQARVAQALNRLDGAAAEVSWEEKTAVVTCGKEIPDQLLRETVEELGYRVTEIRS